MYLYLLTLNCTPSNFPGIYPDIIYVCKEITQNPPRTHVSYVVQFDPKGWIPAWVVNIIASEQARNVLRLKKYLIKHDISYRIWLPRYFERAISAEQTYKFPSQVERTIEHAEAGEAGEANGSDSAQSSAPVEWHEQIIESGLEKGQQIVREVFNLMDAEKDMEAQESLLESSGPVPASRLLKNLFAWPSSLPFPCIVSHRTAARHGVVSVTWRPRNKICKIRICNLFRLVSRSLDS